MQILTLSIETTVTDYSPREKVTVTIETTDPTLDPLIPLANGAAVAAGYHNDTFGALIVHAADELTQGDIELVEYPFA